MDTRRSFYLASRQDDFDQATPDDEGRVDFTAIPYVTPANDNMRTFVQTFRTRLQEAGAPHDDETVWGLLRRLQILVYDFTAPGSADESHSRDRAALSLHPRAI